MSELFIASFTENGIPKTGLTPTISIWEISGTIGTPVITSASMFEIGGGGYGYTYSAYNENKQYYVQCDGGPSLNSYERYSYATNDSISLENLEIHLATIEDINGMSGSLTNDIQKLSGTLGSDLSGISGDLNILKNNTDTLESSLFIMSGNLNTVKDNTDSLESSLLIVSGDLNTIKNNTDSLESGIFSLSGNLNNGFAQTSGSLAQINKTSSDIEGIVTTTETLVEQLVFTVEEKFGGYGK